jgi:hypothetical protein
MTDILWPLRNFPLTVGFIIGTIFAQCLYIIMGIFSFTILAGVIVLLMIVMALEIQSWRKRQQGVATV